MDTTDTKLDGVFGHVQRLVKDETSSALSIKKQMVKSE